MAIANPVSNNFLSKFIDIIDVFNCPLPGLDIRRVIMFHYLMQAKNL